MNGATAQVSVGFHVFKRGGEKLPKRNKFRAEDWRAVRVKAIIVPLDRVCCGLPHTSVQIPADLPI